MQVRTEEEQEKLLRALLIIAKQIEQETFARYQAVMRVQMQGIRELILTMEGEGAFRAYQWREAEPFLEQVMQPVADVIAEQLPPKLALMEPTIQQKAAEFIGVEPPPTAFRSGNAMLVKAMSVDDTLDELLGASGQDAKIVKRWAQNIDRVVKIGLLTDRPTADIADDVLRPIVRNGRETMAIARGTVANQNMNITNNMVRAATWDIVEQNLLSTWKKADIKKWVWNTRLDPDTCPVCAPLEGETADTPEEFGQVPPIHPNCRCSIMPLRFE